MSANALISTLKFDLPDYDIVPITKQNCEQVMDVFESNQAFFLLTEGTPATLQGCQANVGAIPPNFDIHNKLYLGFWKNNRCIATLDFLLGYPNPDCIYIGLFLVHEELHGTGLGRKIMETLFAASKNIKFNGANLAVIENNKNAIAFWEKLGFKETGKSIATLHDSLEANVITMSLNM